MRTIVTGASGFVGSNIAKVLEDRHGDIVIGERIDMTDREAVRAHVEHSQPDAIVHCAILNDLGRLYTHRREAWAAYVGATRNLVATGVPSKTQSVETARRAAPPGTSRRTRSTPTASSRRRASSW